MANTNDILIYVVVGLLMVNISESNPRIDGFGNSSNLIEYQYRYSVDDSKSKGPVMDRWEHRIGEYVKGAYSVLEPDGRIRTVDYEVDGVKGYHAVIRMNEPARNTVRDTGSALKRGFPVKHETDGGFGGTGVCYIDRAQGLSRKIDTNRGGVSLPRAVIHLSKPANSEPENRVTVFVVGRGSSGPGLLSYQQLTRSTELFPAAAVLPVTFKVNLPTRNARNDDKIWNYHSKSPYINDLKSDQRDHKQAGTRQISRRVSPRENDLPLGPANFNVPQTRKLIHFLKPAAFILDKGTLGARVAAKDFVKLQDKEKIIPNLSASERKDTEQRRIRNSKLVKRFKSMDELRN